METDPSTVPLLYLLVIVLLLLGGAYFAICETAFATVSEIRLIAYSEDDNRAKIALKIKENFDSALATILIGNNIMHIACSSVATVFANEVWGNDAVTIMTFIITFIVFIFAEMLPKAYASACNEKLCLKYAKSLRVLIIILTPVTIIFRGLSLFISLLFKTEDSQDITVSEEELFDIIENIDEEDEILDDEAKLVKSALEMTVKTAKDILIPFEEVKYIKMDMSSKEIEDIIYNGKHTRIPVIDKDDKIIGILQIRNYLKAKINKRKRLINKKLLDKVVYVKDDKPIDELLDYMSEHKTHMAFVRDHKKKLLGILTIEDILEELVGEIHDEQERSA